MFRIILCALALVAPFAQAAEIDKLVKALTLEMDEEHRKAIAGELTECGPAAIGPLALVMAEHLGDLDETVWRTMFSTIQKIVLKNRDAPDLDDSILRNPLPNTRNGVFAGIDCVWIPAGWFIYGTDVGSARLGELFNDLCMTKTRRLWLDGYWVSRTEVTLGQMRDAGINVKPGGQALGVKGELFDEYPGTVQSGNPERAAKVCDWSSRDSDGILRKVLT